MLTSRPAVRRVIRIRGTKVPAPARKMFGKALREARLTADMTQRAVAHRTGIDRSYISDIERGLINVSVDTMNTLAEAVGTELEVLLTFPRSPPRKKN